MLFCIYTQLSFLLFLFIFFLLSAFYLFQLFTISIQYLSLLLFLTLKLLKWMNEHFSPVTIIWTKFNFLQSVSKIKRNKRTEIYIHACTKIILKNIVDNVGYSVVYSVLYCEIFPSNKFLPSFSYILFVCVQSVLLGNKSEKQYHELIEQTETLYRC